MASVATMGRMGRAPQVRLAIVVASITVSCGSDDGTVCVSTDVGEVCADGSDGRIEFSGRGLDPESDVVIDSARLGQGVYAVGADGTLDSGGSTGVLSFFTDTEFTFTVWAVDADGEPLSGEIVITT
jgi:hypothetical protein